MFYATIRCSECDFVQWSSVSTVKVSAQEYATNSIRDHLETHEPGRAPNIDVGWEPSASCSICSDGIGDVQQDSDGLRCEVCGTYWDLDGRYGYTDENEDE